jgi:hypothetical protein
VSFEPDSKVNEQRDSQPEKHSLHKISTDAGMQIDRSDEQRNRNLSLISRNFEFGSKATNLRDCPREGRSRPRVTICSVARGMTTEVEPETIDFESEKQELLRNCGKIEEISVNRHLKVYSRHLRRVPKTLKA